MDHTLTMGKLVEKFVLACMGLLTLIAIWTVVTTRQNEIRSRENHTILHDDDNRHTQTEADAKWSEHERWASEQQRIHDAKHAGLSADVASIKTSLVEMKHLIQAFHRDD